MALAAVRNDHCRLSEQPLAFTPYRPPLASGGRDDVSPDIGAAIWGATTKRLRLPLQ